MDQPRRRLSKKSSKARRSGDISRDEDDEYSLTKEPSRGTTGDDLSSLSLTTSQKEVAKQRSRYFDEAFAAREPYNTPRHRVNQDAIVVVEIKTNIEIHNRFLVVSDLAFNLAQIFQRPENSILVTVEHRACLIFGISNEPAYLVNVSSLPYFIAPVTNQRNTVLIQRYLHEALGVPCSRGVIKFNAIPEENFATNGSTAKDEIEQLERTSNDGGSVIKNLGRSMSRKIKSNSSHATSVATNVTDPPALSPIKCPGSPAVKRAVSPGPGKEKGKGKEKAVKKCKSIKQLLFR